MPEELSGGNVTRVVRVGDTVRRPAGPQTPAVHALLEHLRAAGFRHAPRSLGIEDGEHVLEFVPGRIAQSTGPGNSPLDAGTVGAMVRELHDALEDWQPPRDATWACPIPADGADQLIHNDIAPWNIVVADRLVLIDWDNAAPGTRIWDLAYAAQATVPLAPGAPWADVADRLQALADGYRLDDAGRVRLAATLAPRTWSMYRLLERGHASGELPWARLWQDGHGRTWRRDAEWIEAHQQELTAALGVA